MPSLLQIPWISRGWTLATASIVSPSICHEMMAPDAMIVVFWMLSFQPTFSCSCFNFTKRLFSSALLSAIMVVSSAYLSFFLYFQLVFHPAQHFAWCILHISQISRVTIYCLTYSFPDLEPVCSMSSFNCCFLICIQISQEASHVVWYSSPF